MKCVIANIIAASRSQCYALLSLFPNHTLAVSSKSSVKSWLTVQMKGVSTKGVLMWLVTVARVSLSGDRCEQREAPEQQWPDLPRQALRPI